jgi:hypothetical protein
MSFWLQHGYGKSDKIQTLSGSGPLLGAILSPADEGVEVLRETLTLLPAGCQAFLDPQTYVWAIPSGAARCHADHGLDFGRVHWSMPPSEVQDHVRRVVAANAALGLRMVCSPSCIQHNLSDVWTSLALQYARTTLASTNDRVLVSLVIHEAALDDWAQVEEWLDVVTQLDCYGFYLVVVREGHPYPARWQTPRLTSYARLVYRLATLNDYIVIAGYSDIDGLLALASGATALASGWHYSLRSFAVSKWQPSTGGRQPRPRVTSPGLLTPMTAVGEAEQVARSRLGVALFPDAVLRRRLVAAPGALRNPEACVQHLTVLRDLAASVARSPSPSTRSTQLRALLTAAEGALGNLAAAGVLLPPIYGGRLTSYREALEELRRLEGF